MSEVGQIPYVSLKRKRNAEMRQLRSIAASIEEFNTANDSPRIIKAALKSLDECHDKYQRLNVEMLEHDDGDEEELARHAEEFRNAYVSALVFIDDKTDEIKTKHEKSEVPALKDELKVLVITFEEFEEFATENSNATTCELRTRLNDMELVLQQYIKVWKKIYAKESDEAKPVMENDKKKFTTKFYKIVACFQQNISKRESSKHENKNPAFQSSMNLPKIELPTYNGEPELWEPFHDTFKLLVHNVETLSGAVKFRYLKTSIVDVNSPIRHSFETDDGYDDAWAAVLDFYDDKRRILDSHFSSMLKVKPMESESHEEMQRVINEYCLHITSVERLHTQEELFQAMLAHLVLQRLDSHTRDLWETENKGKTPFWNELGKFLKARRKTLSSMPIISTQKVSSFFNKPASKPTTKSTNVHASSNAATPTGTEAIKNSTAPKVLKCRMCANDHKLRFCPQFINLAIPNRLAKVAELKICTNCFGSHSVNSCKFKFGCRMCKQRHHTLLHMEQAPRNTAPAIQSSLQASAMPFSFPSSTCNAASSFRGKITLLQTAMVQVNDAQGNNHMIRAFLDSGSDSNFMSTSAANALNLPFEQTYVEANGIGGNRAAIIKHKVTAHIGNTDEKFQMEFLVTPRITQPTPVIPVDANQIQIPPNLPLADPTFAVPGRIDMLIGNEFYGELLRDGKIKLDSGPVLLNTIFGWIFTGNLPSVDAEQRSTNTITAQCYHQTLSELQNTVEKFYNLEDYRNKKRFLTEEERECQVNFELTYKRNSLGRFIVTILYKNNLKDLKNNFRSALSQFLASERRWQKDETLRSQVIKFMREYESLGHMTVVDVAAESLEDPAFYLPYHAVENPDSTTTKLRVVFNGSAKTPSGISLNDCVGPQVQCDVFTLSLLFRIHPVVIKGDIEKMYRQIEIAPHQRRFQRLIFRENPEEKLKIYEMNTVTYGTAAASYEATRCLQELGIINRETFPEAAEAIIDNVYVDDVITGAKTVSEAKKLSSEICEILKGAGMNLRKFSSNNAEFLQSIPPELRDATSDDDTIKTLGIKWHPEDDQIGFVTRKVRFENVTRRIILSEIASNFDPNGLLGPVTFNFKKFLKVVFSLKLPWDAPMPEKEALDWKEIASTFEAIGRIRIPRHAVIENFIDVQLHGFCDSSDAGYGACIYLLSSNGDGKRICRLLCAKSRIAPQEYRSTARLELCGAVILANLMQQVSESLKLPFSKKTCWSDSAIVLHWLKKCPSLLQIFVANRVSEIHELSTDIIWRHVRTESNPADLISRGLAPGELVECLLWWNEPTFLTLPDSMWPESIVQFDPNEPLFKQEFKRVETWSHTTVSSEAPSTENPFLSGIENSSRLFPMKWKLSFIVRFIHNLRARKQNFPRRSGPINVEDLLEAEFVIARLCQEKYFTEDFQKSSHGINIPSKSKLKNLDPIWDGKLKLMRVGGRLNRAEQCDDNQKHPIILPNCHFARLIIRETHQKNLHAGQNATFSFIRLRYWPIRARHILRQEIHKCVKCFRVRPKLTEQMMGQLPPERVTPSPPFFNTGVDYCVPFDMKVSKLRSARPIKVYIAVFVCLSTKAIHLEIVSDLNTEAFFAAFDKFVSRRGLPHTMNSDNGLNFVGAANELEKLYKFLAKSTTQKEIHSYLAQQEIQWKFIPPRAPSQGGLWEAAVKSMKHHLYRVATNALLTFEEFDRLKAKIEAILNSRPLTAMSDDPADLSALTAGHFLIGRPLIAKTDRNLIKSDIPPLQRWDRVLQMQQHFWKRWSAEYLHLLQVRAKNYKKIVPISVGQLVLLHVDNSPPMHWPLGRIIDIFPGGDGVTRVAKINTATTTLDRPLNKLAILPIDAE